ncbi:MAG: hypothetical protein VX246_02130 [Myxococcota bacterium]|nr:hypothetical protein [Myxococcota bacterium]
MLRLILLLVSIASTAQAASVDEVRAFFDDLVERTNDFDAGVGEMYDKDARIIAVRDGTQTVEMTGGEWASYLKKGMALAKKRGDTNSYSNVELTPKLSGDGFRVTATKTEALKCVPNENYRLDVARRGGKWQVVEEYSETVSLTKCKPSKKLAAALKKLHEGMLPHLPGDIDKDTRLESVELDGSVLTYRQRYYSFSVAELDMNKVVPILQQIAARAACGPPEMKALVDQGASIRYESIDRYGEQIAVVDIGPRMCP